MTQTFTTSTGIDLAVDVYGRESAPLTIALAHCWTADRHDWDNQVRDLLAEFGHDVRIIAWDHRGHGESTKISKGDCTVANLAKDMGELLDAYASSGKLLLAGHSIGGMTMCALAEERPDLIARTVGAAFVSTSSGGMDTVTLGLPEMGQTIRAQIPRMLALRSRTLSNRARRRAPVVERLLVRNFVLGQPMHLADAAYVVEGVINSPAATVVGFYEDMMNNHERTAALKAFEGIPTRVLVGSRDVLTPIPHGRRIANAIPNAELLVAPEAGHMLPLERAELISATLIKLARPHTS
ncbi:MAG TPA: alpha/beta hydrolase [Marmoricola sp.]|nr:alpha/beta hydrolase [Marmoricola sp.]